MDDIKRKICSEVDAIADDLFSVSQYLKDNPETAYKEFKACEHLSAKMTAFGFQEELLASGRMPVAAVADD